MDPKLLEMLVCPVTKGPLIHDRERNELDLAVGAARVSDPRRHPGDARRGGAQAHARGMGSAQGRERRARTRFTVLIPARYASTRLPGKPLADIGGRPMVVRVAERALASGARARGRRHRRFAHRRCRRARTASTRS